MNGNEIKMLVTPINLRRSYTKEHLDDLVSAGLLTVYVLSPTTILITNQTSTLRNERKYKTKNNKWAEVR